MSHTYLRLLIIISVACILPLSAWAVETFSVPMSDGVNLVTDVDKPATGGPTWPVIIERTPYPRTTGSTWTGEGYVYICQSVRGRYGSEGAFAPFADEGWGTHKDGVDTIS